MKKWFYIEAEEQKGPISEEELQQLFSARALHPNTLVWTHGLEEWVLASKVDGLLSADLIPPPMPLIVKLDTIPIPVPEPKPFTSSGSQIRPWIRLWARHFDYLAFSWVVVYVLEPFLPESGLTNVPHFLLMMGYVFAWAFVEPVLVAAFGTTPGKALLNTRVRNADGSTPSFSEANFRSLVVWFKGIGMGLPIIPLITQIRAYLKLTRSGITSWDREAQTRVQHGPIGLVRGVLAFLIIAGLFIFTLLDSYLPAIADEITRNATR